jgi:uncharacterized protein (DUF486 family)
MSTNYKKYIPKIVKDDKQNAIILTCLPALLYTAAAYGSQYIKNATLTMSIIVACVFACLEYIVRVPINFYSANEAGMSNFTMQIVWTIICLAFAKATDVFFPRELLNK